MVVRRLPGPGRSLQVSDVEELSKCVDDIVGGMAGWIYRGQGLNVNPVPRYFREPSEKPKADLRELEDGFIKDFRSSLGDRFDQSRLPDWSILTWLQHFDGPTRLLDWSWSWLVALYFAASSRLRDMENGVAGSHCCATVWFLKTAPDQWIDLSKSNLRPHDVSSVIFGRPCEVDLRVISQESVFSIHRLPNSTADILIGAWENCIELLLSGALTSVSIDDAILPAIIRFLKDRGITLESIYPELDGLAKRALEKYGCAPSLRLIGTSVGISLGSKSS